MSNSAIIKLMICLALISGTLARPMDGDEFRPFGQSAAGNSYTPPILTGSFGGSPGGFGSFGGTGGGAFSLPQSAQSAPLSSFGNPFGAQAFGGQGFGAPGYGGGMPNFFG